MTDTTALLGALQLSDSAFPVGRFVHSQGVEAWLNSHPDADADAIASLATTMVGAAARMDGAFLVASSGTREVAGLLDLDLRLTARKTVPSARTMSTTCGRQLATIAPRIADSEVLTLYTDAVQRRETDGNLAVVTGILCQALTIDPSTAVAVELRSTAAAVLSVAVRLGRLSPSLAQEQLARLRPMIAAACDVALTTHIDEAFSSMPELEICALAHHRAEFRFFTT